MPDIFSPQKRSDIMSRIGGKDTKPEIIVRKLLHALGYRFRLYVSKLPCKPDIVLPKWKVAIFVHGCYWHGHEGCKRASIPKSNVEFWINKIARNKNRDSICEGKLKTLGYKVLIVWQCETKNIPYLQEKLNRFIQEDK